MKYTVEKNVPRPAKGRKPAYPFDEMEVGDSFAAQADLRGKIYSAASHWGKTKREEVFSRQGIRGSLPMLEGAMTNEWGPPLTGEEMKALKGRIDPAVLVRPNAWKGGFSYRVWSFSGEFYHLPANHPYYKVREYNQRHGTNLVLHDGSDKVPDDWDGDLIMTRGGSVFKDWVTFGSWGGAIAYTPKPKESEVTYGFDNITPERKAELREEGSLLGSGLAPCEQMPSDEAIEYVLQECGMPATSGMVKSNPGKYPEVLLAARLIQQYEPDRLKPAVDVAAGNYTRDLHGHVAGTIQRAFKAGAAWRLQHPTA